MSRFRIRLVRGVAALAMVSSSLWGQACSCDGGGTSGLVAKFQPSLVKDESGKADYLVDFGDVSLGDRSSLRVKVDNPGSAALVVKSTPVQRPFAIEVPATGLQVPVGGSKELTFSFKPLEETPEPLEIIATLSTNANGGGSEYTARLVGRGRAPRLGCEPATLDFGTVPQGTSSGLSLACTNELPFPIEVEFSIDGSGQGRSFRVEAGGQDSGGVTVPAGERVELTVRFHAESLGDNEGILRLRDSFNQDLAAVPLAASVVASNLVIDPQTCLDFSYVKVGATSQRPLLVRTLGSQPLTIRALEVSEEGRPSFSFVGETPIVLQPGAAAQELPIEFHPPRGGSQQVQLAIHTTDAVEGDQVVIACAKGFGGGPSLRCDRDAIDFGMVAIGAPVRRTMNCINDGLIVPGETTESLRIGSIKTTNPVFAAEILDGGPRPRGYEAGEGFMLAVDYAPEAERFDEGAIEIETLNGSEEPTAILAAGQGRDLPPCDFSIEPPQLRFGIVDRGDDKRMHFTIRNHGDHACLINDLHLGEGSDPSFSVEEVGSIELEGFERFDVEVSFAPTEYQGLATGTVDFQISDPGDPNQSVPLRASAENPCVLVEPQDLDFGKVGPGCSSREIWVAITNICSTPANLTSVEFGDSSDPDVFHIIQRPSIPRVLQINERVELTVAFMPNTVGNHWASLLVEVEGSEPYVGLIKGEGDPNPIQTDRFDSSVRPRVDILWVMDNSGSFGPYQDRVAENLPAFLSIADSQLVDYHIAVTTSGLTPRGPSCPGGGEGGEDGRFFPVDGSRPRILTPYTQDLESHWKANMKVGVCHGTEEYFEAAFRALSEPLINETKSSKHAFFSPYNDGNAGFLRREASLSIIFVADEPEQSNVFGKTPAEYLSFFKSLKGPNRVRIHGITGGKSSNSSPCNLSNGDRFHYMIEDTGGTWLDICTPKEDSEAWEAGLTRMSEGAFSFDARFILRGYPGDKNGDHKVDEDDIEMFLNGVRYAREDSSGQPRWTYDPIGNAIDFAPLYIPRPGSEITATYEVSCQARN